MSVFIIYCDNLNKAFVHCSHVSLGFTKPTNLCPLFGWLFPCFLTGWCSRFLFRCTLIKLYLISPPSPQHCHIRGVGRVRLFRRNVGTCICVFGLLCVLQFGCLFFLCVL